MTASGEIGCAQIADNRASKILCDDGRIDELQRERWLMKKCLPMQRDEVRSSMQSSELSEWREMCKREIAREGRKCTSGERILTVRTSQSC